VNPLAALAVDAHPIAEKVGNIEHVGSFFVWIFETDPLVEIFGLRHTTTLQNHTTYHQ
jgi:hypothetical protein